MYLVHHFFPPNILPVFRRLNLFSEIELSLFEELTSAAVKAEPLGMCRGVSVSKHRCVRKVPFPQVSHSRDSGVDSRNSSKIYNFFSRYSTEQQEVGSS